MCADTPLLCHVCCTCHRRSVTAPHTHTSTGLSIMDVRLSPVVLAQQRCPVLQRLHTLQSPSSSPERHLCRRVQRFVGTCLVVGRRPALLAVLLAGQRPAWHHVWEGDCYQLKQHACFPLLRGALIAAPVEPSSKQHGQQTPAMRCKATTHGSALPVTRQCPPDGRCDHAPCCAGALPSVASLCCLVAAGVRCARSKKKRAWARTTAITLLHRLVVSDPLCYVCVFLPTCSACP